MTEEAVFENVTVDEKTGEVRFDDYRHGTNGRALAIRRLMPAAAEEINLPKAHKLIFITRRKTVVPPVTKLSPEQAAAYFMLGESIETSAGDPTRAGKAKHEPGFNPFIIGPEEEEGNRLHEILRKHPEIEIYLLNTGRLGAEADAAGEDPQGQNITPEVSAGILKGIALGNISWVCDGDWGTQIPKEVPGIKNYAQTYDPRLYYKPQTHARHVAELKAERVEHLSGFPKLKQEILKAIP